MLSTVYTEMRLGRNISTPVLAPHKTGPGRRPEVDFATIRHYPAVTSVVESKWVGSGGILAADVLWDLLRLELIANASNVPAYFVLAGRRKYLKKFFASKAFLGNPTAQGKYRHLLKLDHRPTGIRIDSPNDDRRKMFRKLFYDYQTVSFPSRISTSTPALYPGGLPNVPISSVCVACPFTHRVALHAT